MSRRIRIRKKQSEQEFIQSYLDQKVNEAFQPIIENLYQLQIFADTVHRNIQRLRDVVDRIPVQHPESIYVRDQILQSLADIENSRYPSYQGIEQIKKEVSERLKTPQWMNDAMADADNMDLSGFMEDD